MRPAGAVGDLHREIGRAAGVGVPVIAPLEVFSVNPAGRLPVAMANVQGEDPPLAARVCA